MNKGIVKKISVLALVLGLSGCSVAGSNGAILTAADADSMIQVSVVETPSAKDTLLASLDR